MAERAAVKPACNQPSEDLRHRASKIPAQGSGAWSRTTISEGQLSFREQTEVPKLLSLPRKLPCKEKKNELTFTRGWALHIAGRGVSCFFHLNEMLILVLSFCRETPGPTRAGGCGSGMEVGSGTLLQHVGHPRVTAKKEEANSP